ncbi:HD family phosphohydrolase [Desulfosarcina ovata subsp. sediminis]|uniref:HD family phosphohydrolase n=1 Tax=Desulfosarcina ovata subsp. sediminis TaxID=885957 RepID=A0A5K7ZZ08_9BACT|nr:HD domain-containing protein [Desulfosarcina ovata]BBO85384.1 HD family phosphohydrolase [Desulfosarcina ovata subsp. sediminis]
MADIIPDPETIITELYPRGSLTRELLLQHGEQVAAKALAVLDRAAWLDADRTFIHQAAMLHDIGIGRTHCPSLGCTGPLPYVCHGVEGRTILNRLGLIRHAWVCERHVGTGITARQIKAQNIPLPLREMLPITVEERLICYADKFFSKSDSGRHEKSVDEIVSGLTRYGTDNALRFDRLHRFFTVEPAVSGRLAATGHQRETTPC